MAQPSRTRGCDGKRPRGIPGNRCSVVAEPEHSPNTAVTPLAHRRAMVGAWTHELSLSAARQCSLWAPRSSTSGSAPTTSGSGGPRACSSSSQRLPSSGGRCGAGRDRRRGASSWRGPGVRWRWRWSGRCRAPAACRSVRAPASPSRWVSPTPSASRWRCSAQDWPSSLPPPGHRSGSRVRRPRAGPPRSPAPSPPSRWSRAVPRSPLRATTTALRRSPAHRQGTATPTARTARATTPTATTRGPPRTTTPTCRTCQTPRRPRRPRPRRPRTCWRRPSRRPRPTETLPPRRRRGSTCRPRGTASRRSSPPSARRPGASHHGLAPSTCPTRPTGPTARSSTRAPRRPSSTAATPTGSSPSSASCSRRRRRPRRRATSPTSAGTPTRPVSAGALKKLKPVNGVCAEGTTLRTSGAMTHLWFVDSGAAGPGLRRQAAGQGHGRLPEVTPLGAARGPRPASRPRPGGRT